MNIRDFEYLIAIDELRSFVKAAKRCFISQPALSQQVKKIENQLGILIFERDGKNIITTPQGQEVIIHAERIINSYHKIKEINNKETKLKIGLIPTIAPYLLPHIVDNLKKKFSDIKFYFLEMKTSELLENLKSGQIDLAILAHCKTILDDKLTYTNLYNEEFLITLPKDSNLTEKDFPRIMDEKKLILLEEGNCMSDNIKDICSIYDENSFNDFYATSIETVKNMVRMNNGIGLLPKLSCLEETNLKTVPFKAKKFRKIGSLIRSNYPRQKLINKINNIISSSVEKI